jgi:hypothetical protein
MKKDMFEENETWRNPRIKGHSHTFATCKATSFAVLLLTHFSRVMKENGDERK